MTDRDAILRKAADACEAFGAALRALIDEQLDPDMKVGQVARELGISATTVREEIRHGRIKARRHGPKLWRIPRAEFDRLKKQRLA